MPPLAPPTVLSRSNRSWQTEKYSTITFSLYTVLIVNLNKQNCLAFAYLGTNNTKTALIKMKFLYHNEMR